MGLGADQDAGRAMDRNAEPALDIRWFREEAPS
jgi:hypothetical protein